MIQAPMDLIQCSSCGQKALRVATRCPKCGLDLAAVKKEFEREHPRQRVHLPFSPGWAGVALFIILVVSLAALNQSGMGFGEPEQPVLSVQPEDVTRPEPEPVRPEPIVASQIPTPAPAIPEEPEEEPIIEVAAVPPPAPEPTNEVPIPEIAEEPDVSIAMAPLPEALRNSEIRWTSTWVNVRESRGVSAPVVAVLDPGQRVQVQRPFRGWSLVLVEGREVGYVYSRFLQEGPETD